jgi:hypothetical protein
MFDARIAQNNFISHVKSNRSITGCCSLGFGTTISVTLLRTGPGKKKTSAGSTEVFESIQ